MSTPARAVTCTTEQSCTLAPSRTTIGFRSPRSTALYQIEARASTVTSPMRTAVGAMNAVGWTFGVLPSKLKSGMASTLAVCSTLSLILYERSPHRMSAPRIAAVATAVPPHRFTQADILARAVDAHLVARLGCREDVQRVHVGDTGCASAMVALEQAWNHLQAFPGHRALVVAVEICSAAYFLDDRLESAVAHAIFADGAGAIALRRGGTRPALR